MTVRVCRPDPLVMLQYYSGGRRRICDLDIALFCGHGPLAGAIKAKTESDYSHVALCCWVQDVLMIGESTSPESRCVCMSSQVDALSGRIDIYRLRPEFMQEIDDYQAWNWMLRASGTDYPETELIRDWQALTFGEGFARDIPNSDDPHYKRKCSGLAHACLRVHGMPPIKPFDCWVYPGHFADPAFSSYLFTLTK